MPIQKSDFIVVNYTGKVKETGDVFDTTSEETAKENRLYKEGDIYEPRLVIVGEVGFGLEALDEALLTFKIGKSETVELPPEKALGQRDPEKVKIVPLRKLAARGITPHMGEQIEYDKRRATVRTMGSGRVTLDFNPPLAGKTLVYELTIQKQLKTAEEKIAALIHRRIPVVDAEKFTFTVEKANLTINVPEDAFYIEGLQLAKRGVTMDVQRFLPELTGVQFVEVFKKPEVAKEPEKAAKKKPAKKVVKKAAKKPAKEAAVKKAEKAPAKKAATKKTTAKKATKKTAKKAEKKATKKAAKKSS